jgi:nucleoside-diphosphate kinase
MKLQQAVILVKPDGLQRGLVGEIVNRFEKKGLKLVALKMTILNDEILDEWYAHHKGKPFFGGLKSFMMSAPIVAMLWEGVECIESVRILTGATKARLADAGSIRGDLAMSQQLNLIHASDSEENAAKERSLIFADDEIFEYDKDVEVHIYSPDERE